MSVSGVSSAILEILKREVPPMVAAEQIGFCSPADSGDNYLLGLFIYSIVRDPKFQMTGSIPLGGNVSQKPPVCVEISFIVTSYIGKKSGLAEDYKLLDRVLQIWHDNAGLAYRSALQPQYVALPRLELLSPDADAVSKIWQFPGVPYRASLFYKAAPVAIVSGRETVTPRVRDAAFGADEKGIAP